MLAEGGVWKQTGPEDGDLRDQVKLLPHFVLSVVISRVRMLHTDHSLSHGKGEFRGRREENTRGFIMTCDPSHLNRILGKSCKVKGLGLHPRSGKDT